ncbi:MAG TPA: serine/threonine-protein kinase, partial [Kofleriaceae bacterium]|nr:serine/threonine-protein kinase [Kofleriaceae bacterium]
LRRIARGGMAEVFLAEQRGLEGFDRRVAVKRILPHLADSPDFVKMFLGEAKLAAQLTHPNIVHIYDFGKVEDDYFIAMEFVDGIHAGQAFQMAERGREKLTPTLIARIGADAATALHYAHELTSTQGAPLGLVHRDVSPANIMISYNGVVKLCDFGIAKAAAFSDQLTQPGQVKGKYAYMSPEQTVAQPLDGRSDVFSLAIVLWELIAGKTIVGRGDAVDAMRAIRDGKLPSLDKVAPGTPAPLVQAISWALETKRERRATAAELATALEAFIKQSPELAGPLQLGQWVRSRFPRPDTTGPQVAIPMGTSVSPGTIAAPPTPGSHELALADDDTSETMHVGDDMLVRDASGSPTMLPRSELTVAERRTAMPGEVGLDDDEHFEGETLQRRAPQANVPTRFEPAQPPAGGVSERRTKVPNPRIFMLAAMFGLAMISFSVVLCVKQPAKRAAQTVAPAVAAVAADAAAAVMIDASVVEPDARAPTITPDALADRTTILRVNTRPTGARVRVADQTRTAPAELALPAGKHVVTIELAGWHTEAREVDLPYGVDTVLEMAFAKRIAPRAPPPQPTGKLSVRTTPWSDVYIGTRKIGQAPFAEMEMPAGTYTLLFKHPAKSPVRKTVTISRNKTTKLSFSL